MIIKRSAAALLAIIMAGALTACVPWPRERSAYVDVCQTDYQFQVPGPKGTETFYLETWMYDHRIYSNYIPGKRPPFTVPYVQDPDAVPLFYLQLIAYNKDRIRPSRKSTRGNPAIPIIYDSRQAYIDQGNGQRAYARPELFLGDDEIYDFPLANEKFRRPSPYDINSDEVHRRVPKVTNNDDYGSVYLAFNVDDRYKNASWVINLGEITMGGQKVTLPPMKLCYHPEKSWIGIEPLIRP